jgi:rod shape-determining protein MreD
MSKFILYAFTIMLDVMLMSLITHRPLLTISQTIPVNTFFVIVLLHTHEKAVDFKEILVLFSLGLFLDVLYATPLFVNAVSLIIVIIIAHKLKTYFNDNGFEQIVFLLILLFAKEFFNYLILFLSFQTTLLPYLWFTRRVFFILVLNIPWMIFIVFIFNKYLKVEKMQQKRRRQKESYNHFR